MRINPILRTDSYKMTHWNQYPPGSKYVYSYLESRGGQFTDTLWLGLHYILKEYFEGYVINYEDVRLADEFCKQHFANPKIFNRAGWEKLVDKHAGRLPLRIQALQIGRASCRERV